MSGTSSDKRSSGIVTRVREMGARRIAFSAVVVAFVGLFGAIAAPELGLLFTAWLPSTDLGAHRIHELAIATTLWAILLGMVAQVRRPETAVAGVYQSALVVLSVFVAGVLGNYMQPPVLIFLVLAAIAAALHPAGRDVLAALRPDDLGRVTLALVVLAAVPLLAFAGDQVALQSGDAAMAHDHAAHGGEDHAAVHEEHVEEGHFASMAGFAVAIVVLGLLASLRPPGWWLSAWSAGAMAAIFGAISVLYPDVASSAGTAWGSVAILWGLGFVAVAELTQDATVPSPIGRWRSRGERGTGQ